MDSYFTVYCVMVNFVCVNWATKCPDIRSNIISGCVREGCFWMRFTLASVDLKQIALTQRG